MPVSSSTSRTAASAADSPCSMWPFGKIQCVGLSLAVTTKNCRVPTSSDRATMPPASAMSDKPHLPAWRGMHAHPDLLLLHAERIHIRIVSCHKYFAARDRYPAEMRPARHSLSARIQFLSGSRVKRIEHRVPRMFGDPLCGAVQPAFGPLGLAGKLAVRDSED